MPARNEYQRLLSMPDLGDYDGKWIAIVGDKVVAKGPDAEQVFKEAKEAYPQKEPLLLKVPKDRVMLCASARRRHFHQNLSQLYRAE